MTTITEQANLNALKVYQALLKQGRVEAEARRDAERWVLENNRVSVSLPAPRQPSSSPFGYGGGIPGKRRKANSTFSYEAGGYRVTLEYDAAGYVKSRTAQRIRPTARVCFNCGKPLSLNEVCEDCRRRAWERLLHRASASANRQKRADATRERNTAHRKWQAAQEEHGPKDPVTQAWWNEFATAGQKFWDTRREAPFN